MNEANTNQVLVLDIEKFEKVCNRAQNKALAKGILAGGIFAAGLYAVDSLWHFYDVPGRIKNLGKKICKEVEDEDTFD